jgi:hypothetical protein
MRFEWDEAKNAANQKKHGVAFEEAQTVFFDDDAILYDDPDHSEDEERFLLVGVSVALRVLVVVHCVREDEAIRIISARRATKREGSAVAAERRSR